MRSCPRKERGPKWLERYMPFVARSPETQVEWLARALQKQVLSLAEITPYLRILLEEEEPEHKARLSAALQELPEQLLTQLVAAADIYDIPKLFAVLPVCTVAQVKPALVKEAPAYEQNPRLIRDRLFYAVYSRAPELFARAAAQLQAEGAVPTGFNQAHARFLELLEDEKLLSALYPKAKAKVEIDIKDLEALQAL